MAIASSKYFVVKPKSARLPDSLTAQAAGPTGLFVLSSRNPDAAPRQQWDNLMRDYGDQLEFASPVMVDDKGHEMLPTGKIVVQFRNPPTQEVLDEFEKNHGLRYLTTNEFAANQLSFEPSTKQAYLPDLIAQLRSDCNVKFAAPETMASYYRL